MTMSTNRQIVTDAFEAWAAGTAHVSRIFAPAMTWEIVGTSAAAGRYADAQAFDDRVLRPFGQRFDPDDPFRPVAIRGVFEDVESRTVIVMWDGAGTTITGTRYTNTYAWFMRMEDGKVVDGVAFFDSVSFDRLWNDVAPA
jgi:uncharacterized protein